MAFSFILDLWNKWNIRGFVVLSLSLQIFLILFAPLRKKTGNPLIISLLWLAYLMADSVAVFAVGLISHNQGNSNTHAAEVDGALMAFWASFLLLHLGGPDTITAFSLEDSSLWNQHLLNLIFQVGAAIYVFVRIFPSDKSLVIPTILVFLVGVIKIAERTWALYLSSLPKLRESMLLDNEQRMGTKSQLLEEFIVGGDGYESSHEGAMLDESVVVKHAYSFFQIFKVFITDLIYTKQQREMSSRYFNKVSAVDALRVISIELNFIYEVLLTKALTIHHKGSYIFRIIAFTTMVVALVLFNRLKKYQFHELDLKITHILLFGGIILDGIALFNLVFSDWTIAKIKHATTRSSKLDAFRYKLLSITAHLRKPRYIRCEVEVNNSDVTYEVLDTPLIFRKWSESIFACNLFSEALKESPRKIRKCNQFWGIVILKNICIFPFLMVVKIISYFLQVGETIARCRGKRSMAKAKYLSKNLFMKKLWIFIFNNLKRDPEEVSDSTWLANIVKRNQFFSSSMPNDRGNIFDIISKFNSLIAWHIVTEIWYNKDKQSILDPDLVDRREFSKILSDYMMYLLLYQPNFVSDVAIVRAKMVATETLRELRYCIDDSATDLNGLCEKLYSRVQYGMLPQDPAHPLKSPLNERLLLALRLEDYGGSKWDQISHLWLQFLQYAAINIKGETHAQALAKGGELLTFVWLLMAHRGCFYKPEWGLYREYWEERNDRDDYGDSDERNDRDDNGDSDAMSVVD